MGLHYPGRSRERILLIGGMGTGKTTAWLRTARLSRQTRSPARFYVLDTDDTVARFLDTEYRDIEEYVEYEVVHNWPDYERVADTYLGKMTPDDFLVVDMIGKAWTEVQGHFVNLVMGQDVGSFYLQARISGDRNALEGWRDYSVINRLYKTWADKVFTGAGHLIACTGIDALRGDSDDPAMKATFGPHGVRPVGQKHLGHEFHTVLWLRSAGLGDYAMTTIKDRGRSYWTGQPLTNFPMDYLRNTAGWQIA